MPGWRQACFYGGLRRDRRRAHLARRGQPGTAVRAHDRAPAARRHRGAADRARPDRPAARADPADPLLRPPARARPPADRLPAVGDRPVRLAPAASSTRPRCATPACTRSSTRCSSASAINMWMCLFGPLPMPAGSATSASSSTSSPCASTGTVLGNIFLWSGTVFYPFYLHGDALHHISPLADQNIAGAMMMVEESPPHARPVLLAVPAHRPRERGAPGPARLRDAPRPRAERGARRARGRRGARRRAAQAPGGAQRRHAPRRETSASRPASAARAHVRWLRNGSRFGRDGLRTWLQTHHFGWLTPRGCDG